VCYLFIYPASTCTYASLIAVSRIRDFKFDEGSGSERFLRLAHQLDVPRCHENTRVAVLEKFGDWVNLVVEIAAFIMWVYGAASTGKSAIAYTMTERLHGRRQLLVATFFFSYHIRRAPNTDAIWYNVPGVDGAYPASSRWRLRVWFQVVLSSPPLQNMFQTLKRRQNPLRND